jgi:pimeloyl-ACP methyl ester carboxylesterase
MRPDLRLALLALLTSLLLAAAAHAAPSGAFDAPVDPDCLPEVAFRGLDPRGTKSVKRMAAQVQGEINRCQPSWFQSEQSSAFNLLAFSKIEYPKNRPYVKRLSIPLADGRKVRGLLAIKPGSKARDLVVVRCGVFCDVGEGSVTASTLMNIYEENPVHVLLLNSASGADWARDNGISHIGGFDEGYQNLEVTRYVAGRQAQFGLKIKNIHIMGVSLGGSSSLFSSFYYEATPDFKNLPVKSFLAVCPMVDASEQFTRVLDSSFIAKALYRQQLEELFRKIMPHVNPIQRVLLPGSGRGSQDAVGAALDMSADYYERNWERLGFSRWLSRSGPVDREELLKLSSIPQYTNQFAKSTLVLHATDDMLVPYGANSAGLLSSQNDRFGIVTVDRGNHCAFATGLGWPVYSSFLSHAFGVDRELARTKHALPPSLAAFFAENPLWDTVKRSHYQWSVEAGSDHAVLKVFQFNGHVKGCSRWSPTRGPGGQPFLCQQTLDVEVPLAELMGLGSPLVVGDAWNANVLERYLNVHTHLRAANGAYAVGENGEPAYLEAEGRLQLPYGVL